MSKWIFVFLVCLTTKPSAQDSFNTYEKNVDNLLNGPIKLVQLDSTNVGLVSAEDGMLRLHSLTSGFDILFEINTGISNPEIYVNDVVQGGKQEIIISGQAEDGLLTIIFSIKHGQLTNVFEINNSGLIVLDDVNNNGWIDLIITNNFESSIYLNEQGNFEYCSDCPSLNIVGTIDSDNNGVTDLIVNQIASVSKNRFPGQMTQIKFNGEEVETIKTADITFTGFPDIISLDKSGNLGLQKNVSGLFQPLSIVATEVEGFEILDFTNDGHLDIVFTMKDSVAMLSGLSMSPIPLLSINEPQICYGHFDGDLELEVIIKGKIDGLDKLIVLDYEGSNMKPQGPDSGFLISSTDSTIFRWNTGSDESTKFLTYNLYVWNDDGFQFSTTTNSPGKNGYAQQFVYHGNLPNFMWAVKSVDNSFVESVPENGGYCIGGGLDTLTACKNKKLVLSVGKRGVWYDSTGFLGTTDSLDYVVYRNDVVTCVTIENGIKSTHSFEISLIEIPEFKINKVEICEGEEIVIEGLIDYEIFEFSEYERIIKIYDFECDVTDTFEVDVLPKPQLGILWDESRGGFLFTGIGAFSYFWTDSNGGSGNSLSYLVFPNSDMTLLLEGTSIDGCVSNKTFQIIFGEGIANDSTLYLDPDSRLPSNGNFVAVPNLFSPNSDGLNDMFYLKGEGVATIFFSIYSSNGNLVYSASNKEAIVNGGGWDGTVNGRKVPAGTYIWYMSGSYDHAGKFEDFHTGENKGIISIVY